MDMASTSRMLDKNWFPRPSPLEAPFTRPAISTNSITAGVVFSELYISVSLFKRSSGTGTTPNVWINGTEWIVCGFCASLGQRVKKCTFTYVWKSYDTLISFLLYLLPKPVYIKGFRLSLYSLCTNYVPISLRV